MERLVSSSFARLSDRGIRDMPPIAEMNTTPLIDVMLVLLIMFIISVPMQTHQVGMNLPANKPSVIDFNPVRNDLLMSADGKLSWNGKRVTDAELAVTLSQIATLDRQPEVHFRPHAAARYERVDEVLGTASKSGATSFGFVGNEQYGQVF